MTEETRRRFKRWLWTPPRPHGGVRPGRTVSFLELFYDLVYVAVIAQAAHHLAEHVTARGIAEFAVIFSLKDTLAATTYYSNPERRLYGKEVGARIQEALKTLSEKERLVFELRHYQGLRLKMIGEIMGSTEETAKNYLFRATQKLRAHLSAV